MRTFKFILKVLMIIIFIISATLNILLFSSSYGTLIFKKDNIKLKTMVTVQIDKYETSSFKSQKNIGYTFEIENEQKGKETITSTFTIYFDKDSTLSYTSSCKEKEDCFDDESLDSILSYINTLQAILLNSDSNTKTSIHFSFSPAYILGIKVSNKDSSAYYDLGGSLRKIQIKTDDENKLTIKIATHNNQIKNAK